MKFLISGYYGFTNLGDEAILAVLIQELRREFPDVELVVLSQAPEETTRYYRVRAINRWSLHQILKELSDASLFISGGGGLIQDRTSRRSPLYYLGLMRLAMRFCPVVVIGQGIGPLRRQLIEWIAKRVFRRVGFAMLRDELSHTWIRRAGLPEDRIFVGGDLLMLVWPAWADLRKPMQAAPASLNRFIGITLSGTLPSQFKGALAEQLDRVYDELGLRPVLISFHLHKDLKELEDLQCRMKAPALLVEPSAYDVREIMECVGQMRVILGMRLHSLIFSLLAARPFVAIAGDPKVERFVQHVKNFGGSKMPCLSPGQIESGSINLVEQLQLLESGYETECYVLRAAGEALYEATSAAISQSWNAVRDLLANTTK